MRINLWLLLFLAIYFDITYIYYVYMNQFTAIISVETAIQSLHVVIAEFSS